MDQPRAEPDPVTVTPDDYRRIFKLCLFYLGNRPDAEDAAQTAFEKILRRRDRFRGEAAVSTWMYRIAVNTALTVRRRRALVQWLSLSSVPEEQAPFISDPAVSGEREEVEKRRRAGLLQGIESLSAREKTAFYLFHYEELPQKEIAVIMTTSLAAVESLVHKAVKKIKKVQQTLEDMSV